MSSEKCYYNSTNCNRAITILSKPEPCHCLTSRATSGPPAVLFRVPYLRIARCAPVASLYKPSRTARTGHLTRSSDPRHCRRWPDPAGVRRPPKPSAVPDRYGGCPKPSPIRLLPQARRAMSGLRMRGGCSPLKSVSSTSSRSHASRSRALDEPIPLIDCPQCGIPVIKLRSKNQETFYKCPNNFKVRSGGVLDVFFAAVACISSLRFLKTLRFDVVVRMMTHVGTTGGRTSMSSIFVQRERSK